MQLKINNFSFSELYMFTSGITLVLIESNEEEFFRKCREIWDTITELTDIDDPIDFAETYLDNDEDEFIMLR